MRVCASGRGPLVSGPGVYERQRWLAPRCWPKAAGTEVAACLKSTKRTCSGGAGHHAVSFLTSKIRDSCLWFGDSCGGGLVAAKEACAELLEAAVLEATGARLSPYRLSAKEALSLRRAWRSSRTLIRKKSSSSCSSRRLSPGRRCAYTCV